jgi:hypothetical protein
LDDKILGIQASDPAALDKWWAFALSQKELLQELLHK